MATDAAAHPMNSRRVTSISELAGDQPVQCTRRVVELLVGRVAVPRLHLGDKPPIIADLRQRAANGGPVVVAEEEVRVHALIAAATAVLEDVLHMDACDA